MKLQRPSGQRNLSMDLLRIVCILFSIYVHVVGRGGTLAAMDRYSLAGFLVIWVEGAGFFCANCLTMISGYFRAGTRHRFSGITSLWLQVFLYSAGITLAAKYLTNSFSEIPVLPSLFPILNAQYWYFTGYFLVFLLAPALDAASDKLPMPQYAAMLVAVGTVIGISIMVYDAFACFSGYSAIWMVYTYLWGGFFRRLENKGKAWKWALFTLGITLVNAAVYLLLRYFDSRFYTYVMYQNALNILPVTIGMFGIFVNLKVRNGGFLAKLIGFFAPLSFGVYLIHTHSVFFSEMRNRFTFLAKLPGPLPVLGAIGVSILIFLVCALVDWVRLQVFRLLRVKPLLLKLEGVLEKVTGNLLSRFLPSPEPQSCGGQDA